MGSDSEQTKRGGTSMARQFQTQTVPVETLRPGDFRLRENGKYRRVLVAEQDSDPRTIHVRYQPNGADRIARGTDVTIKHRDPKCHCGCGYPTKGGLWFPGHDGRVAGLGARAITGDIDALRSLAAIDPVTLPTGGPGRIEHNPDTTCDASCQFAHRTLCVCNCGGTGHYMGWVRIGQMALAQVPEVMTPATQRAWATFVYEEGRNRPAAAVRTGPVAESVRTYDTEPRPNLVAHETVPALGMASAQIVESPNYDEEDLDAFLRRVIPVPAEAEVQHGGECILGGQMALDQQGNRQRTVVCAECGRTVATYPTGRMYKHQRPA
jgi:hypothetical protein